MDTWQRGTPIVAETLTDNRTFNCWSRGNVHITQGIPLDYISGIVTLNSSPVEGAKVTCTQKDGGEMIGYVLTNASGYYKFDVPPEKKYLLVVEYTSEGQNYRALSHWDITPAVVS